MKQQEGLERSKQTSTGVGLWTIIGGAALIVVAAALVVALPDIRRYIKISTM